jgi:hypothetical protein
MNLLPFRPIEDIKARKYGTIVEAEAKAGEGRRVTLLSYGGLGQPTSNFRSVRQGFGYLAVRLSRFNGGRDMARKKPKGKSAVYMMFNVTYEDGSVTSNRRISNDLLDQSFGDTIDDLARTAIEDQDNEIAQRSGQRRAKITDIARV